MNRHPRTLNGAGMRAKLAAAVLAMIFVCRAAADETLESVLARMDKAAPSFKSLAAQLRKVTHTAVINEDSIDTGSILLRRARNDMRMLVEFTEPDPKSVAVHGERIAWIGPTRAALPRAKARGARVHDATGLWITPGLIDCHTHLVYGGDRVAEYEMRLKGASYEQIARAGGGIQSTVAATRAAGIDDAELGSKLHGRFSPIVFKGPRKRSC